jgi:hypothetical protein
MSEMYVLLHRFVVNSTTPEVVRSLCTPTGNFSKVGSDRLRIHTWKGVPGKHVDILLADHYGGRSPVIHYDDTGEIAESWCIVCDIGKKTGRYDGADRWRITLREMHPVTSRQFPTGEIRVEEHSKELVTIGIWQGGCWAQSFPRLDYTVSQTTDRAGILIRQATDWFTHLLPAEWENIRALATAWAQMPNVIACQDINLLNRWASDELYAYSDCQGWVKLTLKQRERVGLSKDSPSWIRRERWDRLRLEQEQKSGKQPAITPTIIDRQRRLVALGLPIGTCPDCLLLAEECDCVA